MNGIVIKQIDNGQSINFDEIVAFAKKLFANKISIEKIEGDYNNVVGLPIAGIYQKLLELGIDILEVS